MSDPKPHNQTLYAIKSAIPDDSMTFVLHGLDERIYDRDERKAYLRSTKPMHERKKKEQSAAPRSVDASGEDAAAGYETTIHQAEET